MVYQYFSKWRKEWVNFPKEEQPSSRRDHTDKLYFINKMKHLHYKVREVPSHTVEPLKDTVHYRPMQGNGNVRCLNGSAHCRETDILKDVTCPKCLEGVQGNSYWEAVGLFN